MLKMCKPGECAAAHELLIQVEGREIAEMTLNCKTIKDELSNISNYIWDNHKGYRRFQRHKVSLQQKMQSKQV